MRYEVLLVKAYLNIFHVFTTCNDDSSTLVSTDKRQLGCLAQQLVVLPTSFSSRPYQRPIALPCVKIGVADSAIFDVDEYFIGSGLRHGDFLVLDFSASFFDDLGPLLFGNLVGHCAAVCCRASGRKRRFC
jgi:hypothetical protein